MDFSIVNKCVSVVAKRNSGKSFLIKYLVTLTKDKFDKIFVICATEGINHFYQKNDWIPKNCIYEVYNESFIKKLMEQMTRINSNKPDEERKNVLLILDDLVADKDFHTSETFKQLFVRGRHINISVIITTQYLKLIPPVSRNNSDFIVVGQLNKQGLDILVEDFCKAGMPKEEFIKIYNTATTDYSFLIINNNSTKTDDINEIYGKIKTPKDFMDANKI